MEYMEMLKKAMEKVEEDGYPAVSSVFKNALDYVVSFGGFINFNKCPEILFNVWKRYGVVVGGGSLEFGFVLFVDSVSAPVLEDADYLCVRFCDSFGNIETGKNNYSAVLYNPRTVCSINHLLFLDNAGLWAERFNFQHSWFSFWRSVDFLTDYADYFSVCDDCGALFEYDTTDLVWIDGRDLNGRRVCGIYCDDCLPDGFVRCGAGTNNVVCYGGEIYGRCGSYSWEVCSGCTCSSCPTYVEEEEEEGGELAWEFKPIRGDYGKTAPDSLLYTRVKT